MTMQDSNKNAACRAYRRIAPRSFEVILLPHFVARAFCGRLIEQYAKDTEYFNPCQDWPHPIEGHGNIPLVLQQLSFLGDTRSRRELLVFAQANPSRLPLAMGISQPGIPVRRMAADRKTKVTDALVRILRRFLTPPTIPMDGLHDQFFREVLLETAGHGEGHVLAVTVALLLAILTGRSDLCICEYMVLDRRASSRCTLGLDRCAPLFGTIVHWMMLL